MTEADEPISDFELHAYVDDQLDMPRRIEVEGYLACNPKAAARIMADLRSRDTLRLALGAPPAHQKPDTFDAARRLERSLTRARLGRQVRRAATAATLVAAGWFIHAQLSPFGVAESEASPPPPAYVEDAVQSHRIALLRAGMRSQIGMPDYDREEIRSATGVVMPPLPDRWRVLDVQVFPSRDGPSVEMAVQAGDLGTLSLFAVRTGHARDVEPAFAQIGDERVVHWRTGELAYALTGSAPARNLERVARDLADRLD